MTKVFIKIFRNRKILLNTLVVDIKTKYAGSFLGCFWLILYPLLFLATYAVVYIFIFRVRLKILSPYEYVLLIFAGLIPFLSFSEAVTRGASAVVTNANLIKNTLFPIEFIPLNISLSSQVNQAVGFLLLISVLVFMKKIGWTIILLIFVWAIQVLFTIGICWFVSALNVFFRDVGNIVPILIIIFMMISPIAYTEDMIPARLKTILYFNPLYYMVMLYQKIFIFNTFDFRLFFVFTVISLLTFYAGYSFFMKLKGAFSDYV